MSSIFDYIFNLIGNYSVKIDDLTDKTAEFQASVAKSQDALTGLGQACISFESVVNVVKNITDVFTGVTNIGANAELQLINMKTLFGGNAEAAQEMYDRISEYGKVTPYDKAGLIDAQKTMMSFGMSGEQAFSTLKQIGDIAMGHFCKRIFSVILFGGLFKVCTLAVVKQFYSCLRLVTHLEYDCFIFYSFVCGFWLLFVYLQVGMVFLAGPSIFGCENIYSHSFLVCWYISTNCI